jgi:type II secretory pathway pseudopilin PulG
MRKIKDTTFMELDGHAKRWSSARADHSGLDDRGFVLVALLVGIAVASIWMAAALPSWRQSVIRQRETELIFRGEQYARAILMYRNQMGSLPTSLDDLVSQHFLRKKYKDPITNEDFLPRVNCQQIGMPGGNPIGAPGRGAPPIPGRGTTPLPGGGLRGPGGRLSQSAMPDVTFELAQAPGRGVFPGRGGPPIPGQMPGMPTQPGRGPGQIPGQVPGQIPGAGQIGGGGICGVQSKSKATSIKIYNGQQQHDLWQFDTTTAEMAMRRTLVRLGGAIQPGQMPGAGMPGTGGPFGSPTRGGPGQGTTPGGRGPTAPGQFPGRGFGPGGQFPPGGGPPVQPGGGFPGRGRGN